MRMLGALILLAAIEGTALAQTKGIPVARLSDLDGQVEVSSLRQAWRKVEESGQVNTGDRVRTGATGGARVTFPFMGLNLGSDTTLEIPSGSVLSILLLEGRAEMTAGAGEIVKLRTAEAEVRGAGRVVVRRAGKTTAVTVRSGTFRVVAAGKVAKLSRGEATVARAGVAPSGPAPAPEPPVQLAPGPDPRYVRQGEPIELSWSPEGTAHHLQLFPVDSDDILMARDVGPSPQSIAIAWLGTFRWRVAVRGDAGLEGLPSREGLICVVEK